MSIRAARSWTPGDKRKNQSIDRLPFGKDYLQINEIVTNSCLPTTVPWVEAVQNKNVILVQEQEETRVAEQDENQLQEQDETCVCLFGV